GSAAFHLSFNDTPASGADLVYTAAANSVSEVQKLTESGSGTFTLSFNGDAGKGGVLTAGATLTANTVRNYLNAIPALNGNVAVTGNNGGPFTISYINDLANNNVPQLSAKVTTGAPSVSVTTTTGGAGVTSRGILDNLSTIPDLSGNIAVTGPLG